MDDIYKTVEPLRKPQPERNDDTIPGRRDRQNDRRFQIGYLILNRYKILAELGRGGMSVVYHCFDNVAGIEIALKALPPEVSHDYYEMEDIKENFQLVANLSHPNIAMYKQLERDQATGDYYLIMEYCKGDDLRSWIKRKSREDALTPDLVLPIIKQIAEAMDYAHKRKIIHRDLKPGNIMIDADGEIKVLDFGLAAQIHSSMTRVSAAYQTSGTGPYMAPEQWRGRKQGAPVDQYALAVMTYEMLADGLPFDCADTAVLREAVLNDTPDDIPDVSDTIQNAVKLAMSKDPSCRFKSCLDFYNAMAGSRIEAGDPPPAAPQKKTAAPQVESLSPGELETYFAMFDDVRKNFEKDQDTAKLQALEGIRDSFYKDPRAAFKALQDLQAVVKNKQHTEVYRKKHQELTESHLGELIKAFPGDMQKYAIKLNVAENLFAEQRVVEAVKMLEELEIILNVEIYGKFDDDLKKGFQFSDDKKTLIKCPADYSGEYVIPIGVTHIGDAAFAGKRNKSGALWNGCAKLTKIHVPASVTSMGDEAFFRCSSLTSINLPDSVTSIGGSAFMYCSSLTSINLPSGVTSIGRYAFCGCSSLTSINLPSGVTSMGDDAFHDCSSLTSINLPDSVTSIGRYAFCGCSSLTDVRMPEKLYSELKSIFEGCETLPRVNGRRIKYGFFGGIKFID